VLYDELIRRTGYISMLEAKDLEENLSRIENVRELKTNIIAFMNENGGSLFDFLSETALYTDLDREDQSTDRVMMMTMHSAKGLEFDTVFIAGAEEGIFPGVRAIGEPEEMEEERRLCYVAMTRAKRRLIVTSAQRRMIFGQTKASEPSRFIREIDRDNIIIHEPDVEFTDFYTESYYTEPYYTPKVTAPYRKNRDTRSPGTSFRMPESPPSISFEQGDKVEHKTFGHGVIVKKTSAGGDALLEIAFDDHGEKRLMQGTASRYMKKI